MKDKIYIVPKEKRQKAWDWYKAKYGLEKAQVECRNGVTFEVLFEKKYVRLPKRAIVYFKPGIPLQFYCVA